MSPHAHGAGNLLINGAFLPGLWTRLEDGLVVAGLCEAGGSQSDPPGVTDPGYNSAFHVRCPVDRQTFAADRWYVRYAAPEGGEVVQARSGETSLEIRGQAGVTQTILIGQRIEANDAPGYRRELRFSVWCQAAHPSLHECAVRLAVRHAKTRDVFDHTAETLVRTPEQTVPAGAWTRLEFGIDATSARPLGLAVELEIPAAFLGHAEARFRIAAAALWPAALPEPAPRAAALETLLARRFCQRHSAHTVNAIGRALVINAHELHFQFTFPEMRAFPAITLPQSDEDLTVFSPEGFPQSGFVYDVPYRSRGSAMIRATKINHHLPDGYLAFRGYGESILLEAEL